MLRLKMPIIIAILALFICGISYGAVPPTAKGLGYFTLAGSDIVRIAPDLKGNLYISDTYYGKVHVISNNGILLSEFNINRPLSIAVDGSGKIFVGSGADGSVSVYDSSGMLLYKLGSGSGEFLMPSDIAISGAGVVYVTDSRKNTVKAYKTTGEYQFSFGAFNFPTGIAVDDASAEVYISDHNNVRIRIYNLNGQWKKDISLSGRLLRPQGIASDADRLYITDAYHSTTAVYSKTGTFLKYIGYYGGSEGEFRIPMDLAFDRDGKLFITNSGNQRVEVIGVDSYTNLSATPASLSFSVFEGGLPVSAQVSLSSDNPANWTASASGAWAGLSAYSGTTPQSVDITANPDGLPVGLYTAEVGFATSSGTVSIVKVTLEVKEIPSSLSVAPSEISLKYQQEAKTYPTGGIIISSTGKSLSWTASASKPWLSLSASSGNTPSTIDVTLNELAGTLEPGTYSGQVTVDAGNAIGSPAAVDVTLRVIYAGTIVVNSNIDEAGFAIKGQAEYSGSGKTWSNDEVTPGTYTISFNHVLGYIKPYTRDFTVKTGSTVVIDGAYRQKPAATHIVAGSGTAQNEGVALITVDGASRTSEFIPELNYDVREGIKAYPSDIDGDGIDEIVVKSGDRRVMAYTHEGGKLASLDIPPPFINVEVAVGDIDHDGIGEVFVGYTDPRALPRDGARVIKIYKYSGGEVPAQDGILEEKGVLYGDNYRYEYSFTLGDINGDGSMELLIADRASLTAYDISGQKPVSLWGLEFAEKGSKSPVLSTGDIDGDGLDEIALSRYEKGGVIEIFKGNGENYGMEINPFGDLGFTKTPSVAFGDIDGDGKDEIAAGSGIDMKNAPLIRLFETDGSFTGLTIKAIEGRGGVNVGLGRFQ
jgi:hypothetical protein